MRTLTLNELKELRTLSGGKDCRKQQAFQNAPLLCAPDEEKGGEYCHELANQSQILWNRKEVKNTFSHTQYQRTQASAPDFTGYTH